MNRAGDRGSQATGGEKILESFRTNVVDRDGMAMGSLQHLVLELQSHEVMGFIVHHGRLHRLDVVVPLGKVAACGADVRLALRADEIDALEFFHTPHFQGMSDHWEMPPGCDQRGFWCHPEVTIPASMMGPSSDRITLNIDAETAQSLAPSR